MQGGRFRSDGYREERRKSRSDMRTRGKLTTHCRWRRHRKSALRVTNPPHYLVLRCVALHRVASLVGLHTRARKCECHIALSCVPRAKAEVVRNNRLRWLYSSCSGPACTHALERVRDTKGPEGRALARSRSHRRFGEFFRFSVAAFP